METNDDLNSVFASFCDGDKIYQYFVQFRDFLLNTDNVIESQKIATFLKCLRVLENSNVFDTCELSTKGNSANSSVLCFTKDLNGTLLSILETFCVKHSNIILKTQNYLQSPTETAITFDVIAYLIKLYILKIQDKDFIEELIKNVCEFFKHVTMKLETYTNMSESESSPLFYTVLKFLAKVLKYVPCNNGSYLSETVILSLIKHLPFPDSTTVKVFINHILPAIFNFSPSSLRDQILQLMWCVVYSQFNESLEMEASETNSCIYTMFCCLSEHMFNLNSQISNFAIYNEIIFWKIILSGLTSKFPFTRKKALNVFKMFLSWLNRSGALDVSNSSSQQPLFFVNTGECLKVWNDVVTLFESLEEKQIHVIKPVLPKFTRILSLTTKESAAITVNEYVKFSSLWVMALLERMLKHETRFVVKWALSTVLSLDFKTYYFYENYEVLIKILIEAFNDQVLFSRNNEQDNYSLFLSSEKITVFLKNCLSALESQSTKVDLLRCLISTIASQSWCAVALLHVTFALTGLDSVPSWNQSDLLYIRKITFDCQRSQEPAFRAAVEYFLLECCTLFLDWNTLHCEDLAELLAIFKSTTVVRHSRPWNNFAMKLSAIVSNDSSVTINRDKATEFCLKCIKKIQDVNVTDSPAADIEELEIAKFARILSMLADSGVISPEINPASESLNWVSLLDPVIETLQCASKRPYMHKKKFLSCVKLVTLLIEESNGCNKLKYDVHTSNIIQCLQNCSEMVEFMYQKLFIDVESNSYISQNNILFGAFNVLSIESGLKDMFKHMVPVLVSKVEDLLDDVCHKRNLLFPLWKMLNTLVFDKSLAEHELPLHQFEMDSLHLLNYEVIWKVTNESILQECLSKPTCLDSIEKEQWLQFSYKAVCDFWDVSSFIIPHIQSSKLSNIMLPLAEEAKKIFSNGPKVAVPYTINCMKFIIPKLGMQDCHVMSDLLDASWVACLELRGNEAFRPALISLIKAIFQPSMLHEVFFDTLYRYIDRFKELSENTIGIFYCVINQFCDSFSITNLTHLKFACASMFVYSLTFGPIHQKAHKIMEETLVYLIERNDDFESSLTLSNNNKPSCYVRTIIVNYLFKNLCEGTKQNEEFAFELTGELLKVDIDDNGKQSSHFANSFSHRLRNRAWQAILILQPSIINQDLNEQLLMNTLNTLGSENQQPSIRYLQEWVIFNILRMHEKLLSKYILLFEKSLEKRPSYIISILSVTNLLILHRMITDESEIIKCFKLITVLCMAQNFTVRLYAQMTLTNLFTLCQQENLGSVILQYEFVSQLVEMQTSLAGQGNFFKNVQKLSNDFYFSSFKPITHFTLETIFYELPRLSNLSPDEWIKPSLFGEDNLSLPIYNPDSNLKDSSPTCWSSKLVNDTSVTDDNSFDYNFQKKIIPIKDMLSKGDSLDLVDFNGRKVRKDGLIVVASLIDRIPNLGGLCRTCEVFGVAEFVIGSLRYTEDKQFQTLAVSADKWVSIKEVKPHQLKEYLTSMKEQGYVLIGAEQTEDSCNLNEYEFPKKTVLLLGHEKEGLPVDLIQLLDVCVQIPQQGVVRSLNVHVSGAILIWEYSRQHNKPS